MALSMESKAVGGLSLARIGISKCLTSLLNLNLSWKCLFLKKVAYK